MGCPARRLLAAAAVAAVALVPVLAACGSPAAGSCVGPVVTVTPTSVAPGGDLTVEAANLWADCPGPGDGPVRPARDVQVVLTPEAGAAREVVLASVTADDRGHVVVNVSIPADTPPGTALLEVGDAEYLTIDIAAG